MAAKKKPAAKPAAPPEPQVAVCVIEGCDQPVYVRGLCSAHWESPQAEPVGT
jgi:hypothetical protein